MQFVFYNFVSSASCQQVIKGCVEECVADEFLRINWQKLLTQSVTELQLKSQAQVVSCLGTFILLCLLARDGSYTSYLVHILYPLLLEVGNEIVQSVQ